MPLYITELLRIITLWSATGQEPPRSPIIWEPALSSRSIENEFWFRNRRVPALRDRSPPFDCIMVAVPGDFYEVNWPAPATLEPQKINSRAQYRRRYDRGEGAPTGAADPRCLTPVHKRPRALPRRSR